MKLIALGLDGTSFELLGPWIDQGNLPNLNRIMKSGVWGDMKSCFPPVSSPNWKCYSTGKNPGKLGIFWWENVDFDEKKVEVPDYRTESDEIWDYLNHDGKKTAVINMPLTYPPRKIDGYISSGGPSAKDENFTYPKSWERELNERGYRVHPSKSISNKEVCRECYEEIVGMIKNRFDIVREFVMKGEVEFIHLTIFYINVLQHFLWGDELLKKAWKVIDEEIGKLIKIAEEEEWNLILFSDHGSNQIEEIFNINAWLERENLLETKRPLLSRLLHSIGVTREGMIKLSEKLGLKSLLRKVVSETTVNRVPSKSGGLSREAKTDALAWGKTTAFASGQGPLYLNSEKMDEREEIIQKLENLENPDSGKKPVKKIFTKEQVYSGKYLERAPDLIIDQAPNIHISGELGKDKVFESPGKWKGENKRTGFFMAYGPDIAKGKELTDINILDIAPTILHLYRQPVPEEMDGKVLKEIFAKGSTPSKREVVFSSPEKGEKEQIGVKIKSLKKESKI